MGKYILAYVPNSLPYNEFEIIEAVDVFFKGELPLKRNDKIYHRDNFTSEMYVVCVSDKYEYLKDNFEELRYQYLKERRKDKKLEKPVPKSKTRYYATVEEFELILKLNQTCQQNSAEDDDDGTVCVDGFVEFGPNRTRVPKTVFDKIRWDKYSLATRSLLVALFGREKLAKCSLTGKQSPAFADKPKKTQLDQKIVEDIIAIVSIKSKQKPPKVRSAITSKCADDKKCLDRRKLSIQ